MFATLFTTTLLFSAAFQAVTADATIYTPELTQCKDVTINWTKSAGPYNLLVVPSDDVCGDAMADLGDHDGTSATWKVDLPAGTKVVLSLLDADEGEAWSGEITVKDSGDTSCLKSKDNKQSPTTGTTGTPGVTVNSIPGAQNTYAPAATTPAGGANPVGAANAGSGPTSGALSARQLPAAVTLLGAAIAVVAAVAL